MAATLSTISWILMFLPMQAEVTQASLCQSHRNIDASLKEALKNATDQLAQLIHDSVDNAAILTKTTSRHLKQQNEQIIRDQLLNCTAVSTIQRRVDGSLNFQRGWTQYVSGFGNPTGNFWLGLERIHQLTTKQPMSLVIEIEQFDGDRYTLSYSNFSVGNSESKYKLAVSGYEISSRILTSDPLKIHDGATFTTLDRDNDMFTGLNCASELFNGGWWYSHCGHMNLNGVYEGNVAPSMWGILVSTRWGESLTPPIKSTEMKIHERMNR